MRWISIFPKLNVKDDGVREVPKKRKKLSDSEKSANHVASVKNRKKHLTDEEILDIRTMKEIKNASNKEIMEKHDIDASRLYAILNYHYRDHIVPVGGTPTFMNA